MKTASKAWFLKRVSVVQVFGGVGCEGLPPRSDLGALPGRLGGSHGYEIADGLHSGLRPSLTGVMHGVNDLSYQEVVKSHAPGQLAGAVNVAQSMGQFREGSQVRPSQ